MPDHIHIFIGMKPMQSLSDLVQDIKQNSSIWINKNKIAKDKFNWQDGFGAFSYSISQIDKVVKYISNQELHHKKQSFIDEYKLLLERFKITYDERYIFKQIE